jgi:hypothetical protein
LTTPGKSAEKIVARYPQVRSRNLPLTIWDRKKSKFLRDLPEVLAKPFLHDTAKAVDQRGIKDGNNHHKELEIRLPGKKEAWDSGSLLITQAADLLSGRVRNHLVGSNSHQHEVSIGERKWTSLFCTGPDSGWH